MRRWISLLCLLLAILAAYWLGRQSAIHPDGRVPEAPFQLPGSSEVDAVEQSQASQAVLLENPDGVPTVSSEAPSAPIDTRSESISAPLNPLQFGSSDAVPHVGALLEDPMVNPKRLRLNAANREQLQRQIDEANRAYRALRSDLHREMNSHARAVIQAGGGEPIVPGVQARAPTGMTMVQVSDKVHGYSHRVFFELGSAPELSAINDESKMVLVSALLSAQDFIESHGIQ